MQQRSKNINGHNGLTLIELLVVVAILAILAGMSISALGEYIPDYRLQNAARELYTNMHKAKMEAIKRNQKVKVVFDVSGERYAISLEDDGNGNWDNIDENDNLKIVDLSKYEGSVRYGSGNAQHAATGTGDSMPSDYVSYDNPENIANFNEEGVSTSGYVYLENTKQKTYTIGSHYGVLILYRWIDGEWQE